MRKSIFATVALALLLLVGCSSVPKGGLPTVWVIPEMKVRTTFEMKEGDLRALDVIKLCKEFNIALYDAFDGQVRVEKFSIYSKNKISEISAGVANIMEHTVWTDDFKCWPHGFPWGRPDYPQRFYTALHGWDRAGVFVHEFMHSWIGAFDEYERGDGTRSSCPKELAARTSYDACVMDLAFHSELCRPDNHNPDTEHGEQREMSCYEWAVKVIKEAGKATIQIPVKHMVGPRDPPEPTIEIHYD